MIERAAPDRPTADDDHARVIGHECLPVILFSLPFPSWSCLARPSTSLPARARSWPQKLVDGRTKSDHDARGWPAR
jgi:hypothetical protein